MRHSARMSDQQQLEPLRVRVIRAHHNSIAVGYSHFVCCYRLAFGYQQSEFHSFIEMFKERSDIMFQTFTLLDKLKDFRAYLG